MTPIGAGMTQEEAETPVLLTDSPRRVWLLVSLQLALENFSRLPDQPSVSQQSIDTLCQRIAQLRQADPSCYIIVSLHWGWENHLEVVPRQRYEARRLIDAGADVNAKNNQGETPLSYAVKYKAKDKIFEKLLASGAKVDTEDKMVQSAVTAFLERQKNKPSATQLRLFEDKKG